MAKQELIGRFLHENQRWDDTIVGTIETDAGQISIKGKAAVGSIECDLPYRFFGYWSKYYNRRSGRQIDQFCFSSFVGTSPIGRAAIICYLRKCGAGNGIGNATAAKIYDRFGAESIKTLRETPEVIAEAFPRIGLENCEAASSWLKDRERIEGCTIELMELFDGRGLPGSLVDDAIAKYGTAAAERIRRDPFALMQFRGCGFARADSLYLDLGHNPARLRRQAYAAWHAIESSSSGDTWFPEAVATGGIQGRIPAGLCRPEAALTMTRRIAARSAVARGALAFAYTDMSTGALTGFGEGGRGIRWVAEASKAKAEERLARFVSDACQEPHKWPAATSIAGLSEHQREQLALALQGSIALLGGSPGTGKTYTAARLIKVLLSIFGANQIGIGCPTGKAAVRINETLRGYGIQEVAARTWHSLLGIGASPGSFQHHEANPLPFKILIGDESSMIDAGIMTAVFAARPKGTMVLLIGDTNQLPPVDHGAPFRDMIEARLPYGELKEIKRNSGGIVETCAAIRDRKPWSTGDNLILVESHSEEESIEEVRKIIQEEGSQGRDTVWDCQVLCAVNKKSKLGRVALNSQLQKWLNCHPGERGNPFRLDDKIVNTRNTFFDAVDWSQPGDSLESHGQEYVANGELAKVIGSVGKVMIVELPTANDEPRRVIKVPRGDSQDGEGTGCDWDLAYALSCHKSQGSEWPVVIVLLDEYPGALGVCDRSWLYTAISRAKQRCYLVGKLETARRFCRKAKLHARKTFLRERILINDAERVLVDL